MKQDLRELFKKENEGQKPRLKAGHQARFLERLEKELPEPKKTSFNVIKIAAAVLVLISAGYFGFRAFYEGNDIETTIVEKTNIESSSNRISLGDLSPDLKKVETYYVANINFELSGLEVSPSNKSLIDSYMNQLIDLNKEYEKLNAELNRMGPNDQTISALIQNLQLRLQLLQRLKKKLNELNTSKNEQVETNVV